MQYQELKAWLEEKNIKLVAVSKTKPVAAIQELYDKGQRDFGENRVQEMTEKMEALPKDIRWHLIGHLQKNKVKYIVPSVYMIHSLDNLALAKKIDRESQKHDCQTKVLLQIKIAQEDSKFGYDYEVLLDEIKEIKALRNLEICGVMGMGTFTDDTSLTRKEFSKLKSYFDELKQSHFSEEEGFKEISMGMSGDYKVAAEYGTSMVRIGSLIFGARN
jgi:pyridoxal phosphate enzyme (YggS family)